MKTVLRLSILTLAISIKLGLHQAQPGSVPITFKMITATEIKPGSRVVITTTNRYGQSVTWRGTAEEWTDKGLLRVRPDTPQAGGQQTKCVSGNSAKLIRQ